jgi:EAL domain-containing protein (putative c-di-GMP-specific phosphodiesterase class I)
MDEWVFFEALRDAAGWWDRLGPDSPSLNLNVTSRRVADASFYDAVVNGLDSRGLPRSSVQVEVTERVLMEASNSALAALRALREGGIHVGLDDFGTGFSSLAYLRQFPLDFVKIDQSFVHGLARGSGEDAIVEAIISLAHAFGLDVVAEGVETPGQLGSLSDLGCDQAQGFLVAYPGEPGAIDELVVAGGYTPD